ncbi:VOC family protein [Paenibacillus allorhizosphaerae]|uniref:VOC domain-containing protein n=1 Tax=Paenibacillus allorhizosphaerae TaxID=2849866 RepID=A0ABM8VB05_9BACL|nr:VOC family protein [Paenibacillus allorhizosphaerae]CAG7618029.1 hypothetical protein PAECIP111802_00477 [Paenibacillus allorhizosphaerae]
MHASIVKRYNNSKSYKPDVIPLALKVLHGSKEAKNKQLIRPNHTINGYMETYIWVNHVDSVYEDLQARGAIIESEPVNQSYGMREFLVYDPDGYRFCIGGPVA